MHFVPGGNDKFLGKALASGADTIVFDLEDSVAPAAKPGARDAVVEWLGSVNTGATGAATPTELMVRVNSLGTPWIADDIAAVVAAGARSLMIPKPSTTADLDAIAAMAGGGVTLFPVATETPTAVVNLPDLAAHPAVDGVCWGAEDLSSELGASASRFADGSLMPVYVTVQSLCLVAARHGSGTAVDAVYPDFRDLDGLRRECELSAAMGWDGKLTIHPDQIEIVNDAFTPSVEAVARARALIEAYAAAAAEGKAAFSFEGEMVDEPHIARAHRLLARAG